MEKPRYVGSVFGYEEGPYQYNVSFDYVEKIDPETGLTMADVANIQVINRAGDDASKIVDMNEVTKQCHDKAAECVIRMVRPESLNGN